MNRTIASLAMVKVNYERRQKDYIDNFLPFVATLVLRKCYPSIDTSPRGMGIFIQDFEKEFGLRIPYLPMLTILDRARRKDFFTKSLSLLTPITEELKKHDLSDDARQKEIQLNKLVGDFISFSSRHDITISNEKVEEILISFLHDHDLDILFASQEITLLPKVKISRSLKYLFALFVKDTLTTSPEIYKILTEVCMGHILANTVLYELSFEKFDGKMRGLDFYFDSRFVFRLRGWEGPEYAAVYEDLLDALNKGGANLYIFEHTYEEILRILKGTLNWIGNPLYDPSKASRTLRYFVEQSFSKADIHQFLSSMNQRIEAYNIHIKKVPEGILTQEHQISYQDLKTKIIGTYTSQNINFDYIQNEDSIDKDIKSIEAIFHLRKGTCPETLHQGGAYFITPSFNLAMVSKEYMHGFTKGGYASLPVCLTDIFLGTLIWLQAPKEAKTINEKRRLADFMALLKPDDQFLKRFLEIAKKAKEDKRITEDEFHFLSTSLTIETLVLQNTLGDLNALRTETLEDALERIKKQATAPIEEKYNKELTKRQELEKDIAHMASKEAERINKIDLEARSKAKKFEHYTNIVLCLLFLPGIIISIIISFIPFNLPSWGKISAIIFLLFYAIIQFFYHWDLREIRQWIGNFIYKKEKRSLTKKWS